jgi:hypothetical protein
LSVKRELSGEDHWGRAGRGGGKGRIGCWGVKRIEEHYVYTYKDGIMKPTKHCLEKWGRREGVRGI